MTRRRVDDRYEVVKDYVLLVGGVAFGIAAIIEGLDLGDVQLGVAFVGACLTCWGLVPTLARDKEEKGR